MEERFAIYLLTTRQSIDFGREIQIQNIPEIAAVKGKTRLNIELTNNINQAFKTGLIVDEKSQKNPEQLCESEDYDVLSAAYPLIDKAFMQSAAEHHKEVYTWIVSDKARLHHMLDLRVNSVITNYPKQLVEVLKERGARD